MFKSKYTIWGEIIKGIKLGAFRSKWHKCYPDSDTIPTNIFNIDKVVIGKGTYGELHVIDFGDCNRLVIGNYVSIAQNVSFLLNAEHRVDYVSTYPYKVKALGIADEEAYGKGDIVIDDDVWIGYGAIILSGVHINQGAIIAAGSVVTKDVPAYAIVGGNPARTIKYRFREDIINAMMTINYDNINNSFIKNNIDNFYSRIENINQLDWIINR